MSRSAAAAVTDSDLRLPVTCHCPSVALASDPASAAAGSGLSKVPQTPSRDPRRTEAGLRLPPLASSSRAQADRKEERRSPIELKRGDSDSEP